MKAAEVGRLRARALAIRDSGFERPEGLLERFGAVQAQDFHAARWALGLRLPGSTLAEIDAAIAEGKIVRSWPMRGTLHFVARKDLGWMLELLGPRVAAYGAGRLRELGLDEPTLDRCASLFEEWLGQAPRLARLELLRRLEDAGIPVGGQRGIHVLFHLSLRGLICSGPQEGKEQTFELLARGGSAPRSGSGGGGRGTGRESRLAELALRYFTGHGPATLADFIWWTGLKVSDARAAVEAAADRLARDRIGEADCWLDPALAGSSDGESAATLLPAFDEFLIGYKDRSAVLAPRHRSRVVWTNGVFFPTMLVGSAIAGTWKRRIKGSRLEIELSPFEPMGARRTRAFERAADDYGRFVGLPTTLV